MDELQVVCLSQELELKRIALADAGDEIERLKGVLSRWAKREKCCQWKADSDGIFQTGCGHSFYFDDNGGPGDHQLKFCGYCGASLVEVNSDSPTPKDIAARTRAVWSRDGRS